MVNYKFIDKSYTKKFVIKNSVIHGKQIKYETIANKFNEHTTIQVGNKLPNNMCSPNKSFNDYLTNSNYYSLFVSPIKIG